MIRRAAAGNAEVRPVARFGPWADDLWRSLAPDLGTAAIRDAAYLNWRFCEGPAATAYERFALHRDGAPVGLAVTSAVPWRGATTSYLMELMVAADDVAGARHLLGHAVLAARRAGAAAMNAVATRRHPHRKTMMRAGFLPVPNRLLGPRSFGVRHNGPGVVANRLFHVDDWYLSFADIDVV